MKRILMGLGCMLATMVLCCGCSKQPTPEQLAERLLTAMFKTHDLAVLKANADENSLKDSKMYGELIRTTESGEASKSIERGLKRLNATREDIQFHLERDATMSFDAEDLKTEAFNAMVQVRGTPIGKFKILYGWLDGKWRLINLEGDK